METLCEISRIAGIFVENYKKWEKKLCFGKILPDSRNLVSFDALEPIRLLCERKDGDKKKQVTPRSLVPIASLPVLNGNLIGLSGYNAGGKTVTKETLIDAIYMTQSGLPMFGAGFALNPKRIIGLVFLERGDGSTSELLLRKTKNVLDAIIGAKENGILVVIDEVGGGTQEEGGLHFGKKLLKTLQEANCSAIFSTQIIDLSKYAESELDAKCFYLDANHCINSGIESGHMDELMTKVGIDELLV